jgi:hypothetical protein
MVNQKYNIYIAGESKPFLNGSRQCLERITRGLLETNSRLIGSYVSGAAINRTNWIILNVHIPEGQEDKFKEIVHCSLERPMDIQLGMDIIESVKVREVSDFKYLECHITIEPVFDERLEMFKEIIKPFGFKAAKLLMQKNRNETAEISNKDTFCTGHGDNYEELHLRMTGCLSVLMVNDFKVLRSKIEAVIFGERRPHEK